ncbi:MAG TPA: FecR family protein [Usitatibacter sp.]|jgi:hypothetical protein|nr:FecR family protein [Usitatibacter sp.]
MKALHRFLACAGALVPIVAAAASGQFTFITGQVSVTKANGQTVAATRGASVDPGDRITTAADGMAQLTMVDQARLSLRPNTVFVVEQYPQQADSTEGVVLTLLRGTLRTFTSLISPASRDRYVMKTRVATVGIRGSGNILYYCEQDDCDPSVTGEAQGQGSIAVNHTIEGSHIVTNVVAGAAPGLPAQQGGAQSVITGPGQTVLVLNGQAPRYVPTPAFIANAATTMTNAKSAASTATDASDLHAYAPGEVIALPEIQPPPAPLVGNNGLGFPLIDASGNIAQDPTHLRDIVIAGAASPLAAQSVASDMTLEGDALRGFRAYPVTVGGLVVSMNGGTAAEAGSVSLDGGGTIFFGRWDNTSLSFGGAGVTLPGGVHWIYANSGYPMYLSDVLTGTASYTLAGHTAPTNQNGTAGTLNSASLDVNFTNRTAHVGVNVSVPGSGGGSYNMNASNVPLTLNNFSASTSDRLVVTNGGGQSSSTNPNLSGIFQGSLVGTGLTGAILGYGVSDRTSGDSSTWSFISGVAAFQGPSQNSLAPYREGRVSDAGGFLTDFIQSYATTDRPDEVVLDTQNRVTAFTAPFGNQGGSHVSYTLGSAQVVESGFDPETGMVWGRWSGGAAQVGGQPVSLANNSVHYIFAGAQSGPVTLPLTGTATYDVIGSTSPTDFNGHVGHFNSATLNANFSARTADASVNFSINGQTWNGAAANMPIYRDQYFSAYAGSPIAGLPNPNALVITCAPNCGAGATGSFDGFFAGRNGSRAGMVYNVGGNQGAVAFGQRPGG